MEGAGEESASAEVADGPAPAPDLAARIQPVAAGAEPAPATGAESTPPVADVPALIALVNPAAVAGDPPGSAGARSVRGQLSGRAAALRTTVEQRAATRAGEIHAAFMVTHGHLDASVTAARKQIAVSLKARRAEVEVSRTTTRKRFTNQFGDHRKNVETTVTNAVTAGNKLKTDAQDRVVRETSDQAAEARNSGIELGKEYPKTERGVVQKDAAWAIADRTATEMQEKVPEAKAACADVVEELPKGFREGGVRLLEGFDEGLPGLLTSVDQQAESFRVDLGPQALQAQEALDTTVGGVRTQLHSLEAQAVSQAREIVPLLTRQINAALRGALAQVDDGAHAASARIQDVVDQAVSVLTGAGAPDPAAAEAFTARIEAFAGDAAKGAGDLLQETGSSVASALGRVVPDADAALRQVEQGVKKRRDALSTDADSAIADFVVAADELLGETVARLQKRYDDKGAEIDTRLTAALTSLKTAFNKTLADAGAMITRMVDAGLHENSNLLFTLRVEMKRGAYEAAWDFDHPYRAFARTALEIIGGIILGLLAVALLVVVAIVAFKVAVAALVAIGIPAAIATVIVVVAGLALLGYGLYSAYSTRRRHGESIGDALAGAALDVTGINEIIHGALRPHLSPFERAYSIAHGVGTLVALVLPFAKGPMKRINGVIDSFLPGAVVNPSQGAAWRALGRALGIGKSANPLGGGLFGGAGAFPELENVPIIEPPRLVEPLKVAELPPAAKPAQVAEPPTVAEPPGGKTAPPSEPGSKSPAGSIAEPGTVPPVVNKPVLPEVRPPGPVAANDNVIPIDRGARPPRGIVPETTAPKPVPNAEPLPAHAEEAIELVEAAQAAEAEAALAAEVPQQAAMGDGLRPGGVNRLTVRNSGSGGGKGPTGPNRPPPPGRGSATSPQRSPAPRRIGPRGIEPPASAPPEPTLPEQLEAILQKKPTEAAKDLDALAAERKPQLKALDEQIEQLTRVIEGLGEQRTKEGGFTEGPNGERAVDPRQDLQDFIGELQSRRSALRAERAPLAQEAAEIAAYNKINTYKLNPDPWPCFAAGTEVWTELGPRPIEQIREGWRVWAYSFDQQRPLLCRVSAVTRGLSDHFYHVRVAGRMVLATGAHPFWVEALDGWVPARDLAAGMPLKGLDPGRSLHVEAAVLVELVEPEATFNLSVDGAPSYYVGPGFLVHNTPPAVAAKNYGLGKFTVYEGVYTGNNTTLQAKYRGRIYIGQTVDPVLTRQGGHRWEAIQNLRKSGLTPEQIEFWEFKRDMTLRPRIEGLNKVQADYFEQFNLNLERENLRTRGGDTGKVMYRREQAVPERFRSLAERIAADAEVKRLGLCPR